MPNRKLCEVPGDGLKLSEAILESHTTMTTLRCFPLSRGFGVCPASWRVLARQSINGSQAEGALAQPIFDFAPKLHTCQAILDCLIYDVPVTKPCDLESVSYNLVDHLWCSILPNAAPDAAILAATYSQTFTYKIISMPLAVFEDAVGL